MIKKILIGGFWALVLLPNLLFMLAGGKGDGGGDGEPDPCGISCV